MEHKQSELTVITKAKDLCSYVMTVTQKSPKQFRLTFTSRLQNLLLDVIGALHRANDTFLTKENVSAREKDRIPTSGHDGFKAACILFTAGL